MLTEGEFTRDCQVKRKKKLNAERGLNSKLYLRLEEWKNSEETQMLITIKMNSNFPKICILIVSI